MSSAYALFRSSRENMEIAISKRHLSDVVAINLGESHENMSFLFLLNVGV